MLCSMRSEKAVSHQIYKHMFDTSLYANDQLVYRVNHSAETALLKVKNDTLLNMNRQHVTLLLLLDLSAAFDTVEHNILLEVLNTLGLGGRMSNWFRSYLSAHSQRISVHGCLWEKFDLDCGIPQGSCLGSLLFTIYTSSLLDVFEIIFHLSIATQIIRNFTFLLLRRSSFELVRINYCWTKKKLSFF